MNRLGQKRFKLLMVEQGEGCDYTIACGTAIADLDLNSGEINPNTITAACKDTLEDYGLLPSSRESKAKTVLLIRDWVELPYEEWDVACHAELKAEKSKKTEQSEKALLRKLQAKYGNR